MSTTFAQKPNLNKGEFSGLIRAGIVASQIHNDDVGGYNKFGGTLGGGVFTPIGEDLNLQMEINYAMRGSRKRPDTKNFDYVTFRLEPHYVDVPILLKKFIWKFEFEAGLNNGFFLFSRITDPNFVLPTSVKDFNRYELAANLGVNVPINEFWHTNVRLHYSITPASGRLQFVNGFSLLGGAYNNAVTFSINRVFYPKD
ncbi:MAG: outer membrane beta-barrel protein [Flavobacteriales bacterium]|nr:outer membrane beta-barrel protein [Flavobacteriales bacterium]